MNSIIVNIHKRYRTDNGPKSKEFSLVKEVYNFFRQNQRNIKSMSIKIDSWKFLFRSCDVDVTTMRHEIVDANLITLHDKKKKNREEKKKEKHACHATPFLNDKFSKEAALAFLGQWSD